MCDSRVMRIPACIWLCPEDRVRLERLIADRNTPRKVVWRSRIVLLSAAGCGTMEIMRRTGISPTVWRWQARYLEAGVDGLCATRAGRRGCAAIKTLVATRPSGLDGRRSASALGARTASSRIWWTASRSPAARRSRRKSRTWSASTSIRTLRSREEEGTRPQPTGPEEGPGGTMTHDYKRARPPCSRRSTCSMARSSATA